MSLPKVSLIFVTCRKENQRLLDTALASANYLHYPKEQLDLHVVSGNGFEASLAAYEGRIIGHFRPDRIHYAEAINYGISFTDNDTEYYWILNDDVILTPDSLFNMVEASKMFDMVLNPISNCDNQALYVLPGIGYVKDGQLVQKTKRFYKYEEWQPEFQDLMKASSLYPPGLLKLPFCPSYATLVSKKVWDKVGGYDGKFLTGQEDLDFSKRAAKLNIPSLACLNALVWHYGNQTAEHTLTDEIRQANINYYKEKHGEMPV